MGVILRQRQKAKNGKISLYLDISHKGRRSYEYLNMYLHPIPPNGKLDSASKAANKKTLELAKAIKAKYEVMIYNKEYEMGGEDNLNASFFDYFQALANKRKNSFGNYGNWDSTLKHLKKYTKDKDVSFAELNSKWVEGFKEY